MKAAQLASSNTLMKLRTPNARGASDVGTAKHPPPNPPPGRIRSFKAQHVAHEVNGISLTALHTSLEIVPSREPDLLIMLPIRSLCWSSDFNQMKGYNRRFLFECQMPIRHFGRLTSFCSRPPAPNSGFRGTVQSSRPLRTKLPFYGMQAAEY